MCEWIQLHPGQEIWEHFYVVFISNPSKTVVLWEQRASSDKEEGMIIWDYHCILVYRGANLNDSLVYDFDTRLGSPMDAYTYLLSTFRAYLDLKEEYQARFRVMSATDYLAFFSSDRSHMTDEETKPIYPCIRSPCSTSDHHLPEFWDMQQNQPNSVIHQHSQLYTDLTEFFLGI